MTRSWTESPTARVPGSSSGSGPRDVTSTPTEPSDCSRPGPTWTESDLCGRARNSASDSCAEKKNPGCWPGIRAAHVDRVRRCVVRLPCPACLARLNGAVSRGATLGSFLSSENPFAGVVVPASLDVSGREPRPWNGGAAALCFASLGASPSVSLPATGRRCAGGAVVSGAVHAAPPLTGRPPLHATDPEEFRGRRAWPGEAAVASQAIINVPRS